MIAAYTPQMSKIELAYKTVVEEIQKFCASNKIKVPSLVAVSKFHPIEEIQQLYDLGHREFGENYVQELTTKAAALPKDIKWHFIGNLQSNKAKIAGEIPNLAVIETIDSASKATKVNKYRTPDNKLGVYIQVNTSGESQKSGVAPEEVPEVAAHIHSQCPNLELVGLMTIGSLAQSTGQGTNSDFEVLATARTAVEQHLGLAPQTLGLSMGMSNDFIEAIRQGSTNVRIGSTIFGPRPTKEQVKAS